MNRVEMYAVHELHEYERLSPKVPYPHPTYKEMKELEFHINSNLCPICGEEHDGFKAHPRKPISQASIKKMQKLIQENARIMAEYPLP